MLQAYREHVAERAALGIPPLPLTAKQTADLIELLKNPPAGEEAFLVDLLTNRVPAGVDDAARVKASYLAAVAHGDEKCALISAEKATELLGTMLGGYNVAPLVDLLDNPAVGTIAADALKKTLLVFDQFHDVKEKADKGNANAKAVLQSWADAEWFTSRPEVPESLTITVFKVAGETNTDDLSPAPDAWSRPDIPLHALAMLKNKRSDAAFEPEEDGKRGPVKFIEDLRAKGNLVAYVGDVVGTGSSRKSATNSVLWFTGEDVPFVPNKRFGGVCLGSKIAPIFYNTMEDAGALPIELDVSNMNMGDVVELRPYDGKALKNGEVIAEFKEVHGDKYDYSKVIYTAMAEKVTVTCPVHGDWDIRPFAHKNGQGCMKCRGYCGGNKNTNESITKKAKAVHGDRYDYSKMKFESILKKIEIVCPDHGSFWPGEVVRGLRHAQAACWPRDCREAWRSLRRIPTVTLRPYRTASPFLQCRAMHHRQRFRRQARARCHARVRSAAGTRRLPSHPADVRAAHCGIRRK